MGDLFKRSFEKFKIKHHPDHNDKLRLHDPRIASNPSYIVHMAGALKTMCHKLKTFLAAKTRIINLLLMYIPCLSSMDYNNFKKILYNQLIIIIIEFLKAMLPFQIN